LDPAAETHEAETGSRAGQLLFRHRPEDYRRVVKDLSTGRSIRSICKSYEISPDIVIAIRQREGITINRLKSLLSDKMAMASQMAVEALMDSIMEDKIKPHSLPFATAVLVDKAMLLGGEATSRVEVKEGPDVNDFAKIVEALPVQDAEVAEVPEFEVNANGSHINGGESVAPKKGSAG
tara:strand:- start:935 stop:1471 length:537 start_codon:yes stop_codon:yes gene_type:complete